MKRKFGIKLIIGLLAVACAIVAFSPSTAVSKLYKVGYADYKKTTIASGDTVTYIP
ncbi:MAG: hypothetical protein HC896_00080 [Bacteroidales bacterium]|nr:hypothetical protein [Bacteroidales bacterium]